MSSNNFVWLEMYFIFLNYSIFTWFSRIGIFWFFFLESCCSFVVTSFTPTWGLRLAVSIIFLWWICTFRFFSGEYNRSRDTLRKWLLQLFDIDLYNNNKENTSLRPKGQVYEVVWKSLLIKNQCALNHLNILLCMTFLEVIELTFKTKNRRWYVKREKYTQKYKQARWLQKIGCPMKQHQHRTTYGCPMKQQQHFKTSWCPRKQQQHWTNI